MLSSCVTMRGNAKFVLVPKDELKQVTNGVDAWVYRNPKTVLQTYDKVMIEPIVLQYDPKANEKGIYPRAIEVLAKSYEQIFRQELGKEYQVVDETGPRVLLIRTAFSSVIPFSREHWAIDARRISPAESAPFHLGNTFELDVLDAQSEERLFTFIEQRNANSSKQPLWSQVNDQLIFWAKNTRKQLRNAAEVR